MSVLTPASEVILRHSNEFTERRVLFAGDWQDTLPAQFIAATVLAHTNQYHHWQLLKPILGDKVTFSFSADKKMLLAVIRSFIFGLKINNKPNFSYPTCWLYSLLEVIFLLSEKIVAEYVERKISCGRCWS